jgi:hypothetical protein
MHDTNAFYRIEDKDRHPAIFDEKEKPVGPYALTTYPDVYVQNSDV